MQLPSQEGHHHVQMHRAPTGRMVRTMSVPHIAMGPGQHQSMYSEYNHQVRRCSQASPAVAPIFLKSSLIPMAV